MALSNQINETCWGNVMPTEILINIFTRLSPKPVLNCREVCARWKLIIDDFILNDQFWHEHYKNDFNEIYRSAKLKARPELTWFQIYRSLSFWPKLSSALEVRKELRLEIYEDMRDFQVLNDGSVGVLKRHSVDYYDIATLQRSKKESIYGDFSKYAENDYAIVTITVSSLLCIYRKTASQPKLKMDVRYNKARTHLLCKQIVCYDVAYDNARTFLLFKQYVYFANRDNVIGVYDLSDENMIMKVIGTVDENVICFGVSNSVYVLTVLRNIYTIVNQQLSLSCTFNEKCNLLHYIRSYNLLEGMDWLIFTHFVSVLHQNIYSSSSGESIVVIRCYGNVLLVGSDRGVLRVYYAPNTTEELDLFSLEPVRQYNFRKETAEDLFHERNRSLHAVYPIVQIDAMEAVDGHTIIVGTVEKIVILNLNHDFNLVIDQMMLEDEAVH